MVNNVLSISDILDKKRIAIENKENSQKIFKESVLTEKYRKILKDFSDFKSKFDSNTNYVYPILDVNLDDKNKICNPTSYGSKLYLLKLLTEEDKSNILCDSFIYIVDLQLKFDYINKNIFDLNELNKKNVYIDDNQKNPISNFLGNVYISTNDAKNSNIDLILVHEAAHYYYTNLISLKYTLSTLFGDMSYLQKHDGVSNFKKHDYNESSIYESHADIFSILFLKYKKIEILDYIELIKKRDSSAKERHAVINAIYNYINKENDIESLIQLWDYVEDAKWVSSGNSKKSDTLNFSLFSIKPIEPLFRKHPSLIQALPLFKHIQQLPEKEREHENSINKRFGKNN